MTIEEIKKIFTCNQTNQQLASVLNDDALGAVADVLLNVPASDFVELNPDATKKGLFSLSDVPVPVDLLDKERVNEGATFSPEINVKMNQFLNDINEVGTNVEYPCALYGENNNYGNLHKMYKEQDIEKLAKQSVVYDAGWVSNFVSKNDNCNLALMHTHPASLGKDHNTLFNKYKEQLSQLGVKPDGLNISLQDVYTQKVVEDQIKSLGKNISLESVILMHDGTLVSFNTKNGLTLTHESHLERQKEQGDNNELTSTSPEAKVTPVSIEEIRETQKEILPDTYGKNKKDNIVKTTYSQSLQSEDEISKGV